MFKDRQQEREKKALAPNRNGSDQAVVIRTLGAPVEVTLAGQTYLVTAGSLRFHEKLTRFQDSGKKNIRALQKEEIKRLEPNQEAFERWRYVGDRVTEAKETIEKIVEKRKELNDSDFEQEKYEAAVQQRNAGESELALLTQEGYLTKVLLYMKDTYEITERITISTNEHCLRLIQLILLNSKNPKWYQDKDRVDTQGFPIYAMLEEVIPLDVLYNEADINELNNVVEVFGQINQPELFRKNALALTGMQ